MKIEVTELSREEFLNYIYDVAMMSNRFNVTLCKGMESAKHTDDDAIEEVCVQELLSDGNVVFTDANYPERRFVISYNDILRGFSLAYNSKGEGKVAFNNWAWYNDSESADVLTQFVLYGNLKK
jgi:hypothetical protein